MMPFSEKDLASPYELLDHATRQKLVFHPNRLTRDYLSAGKAGGTWVPMVIAVRWWFMVGRNPSQTSSSRGGVLYDLHDDGTYTRVSDAPADIGQSYEDVTAQVEQELLAAERLAKPHHFRQRGDGTEVPAGYLETLHEIWERRS